MNITQLMRNLLGDLQPAEGKLLELKVGQVVKGMVLQLLSDQEAVVNIAGVHVRAKLETPLNKGQVTLLQVQPESKEGQIILRPIGSSAVPIAEESLSELVRSFGLKDLAVNRQLLQQMHQHSISLTKDNVQAFKPWAAAQPDNMNQEEWLQAGVIAYKRGLPLTEQSVRAVHQVLFGKPLHQTLNQLNEQAVKLLQGQPTLPTAVRQSVLQLVEAVRVIQSFSSTIAEEAGTSRQPQQPHQPHQPHQPQQAQQQQAAHNDEPGAASRSQVHPAALTVTNSAQADEAILNLGDMPIEEHAANQGAKPGQTNAVSAQPKEIKAAETVVKQPGIPNIASGDGSSDPHALPMNDNIDKAAPVATSFRIGGKGNHLIPQAELDGFQPTNADQLLNRASEAKATVSTTSLQSEEAAKMNSRQAETGEEQSSWISRIMDSLGLEHERRLAGLPDRRDALQANMLTHHLNGDYAEGELITDDAVGNQRALADSLKHLLLQIVQADDIPPAMREAVQQALQQVTGQQLLMIPDRNSMFSHVTLFIPIINEAGEQTAAVHVQSRKGKNGELDTNNCRLWFDLHMNSLGATAIDVQVVNRIVSLQVHNDHPLTVQLMESGKKEIAAAMEGIGYHLLSMKSAPFPQKIQEEESANRSIDSTMNSSITLAYRTKPYKGVDIRI